jgi:hypothetical protein
VIQIQDIGSEKSQTMQNELMQYELGRTRLHTLFLSGRTIYIRSSIHYIYILTKYFFLLIKNFAQINKTRIFVLLINA